MPMLRRLYRRRSWLAALALGLAVAPILLGGVAAAPTQGDSPLPPPELNPLETPPADATAIAAAIALVQTGRIADLVPVPYRSLVLGGASKHRIDPRLIAAVILVETNWDPDAIGYHGEVGLMQILPGTAVFLAEAAGLTHYNLSNPATSIDLGSFYLADLLQTYGSIEKALAAYNGGPSAADGWESNPYVDKVMNRFNQRPQTERAPSAYQPKAA